MKFLTIILSISEAFIRITTNNNLTIVLQNIDNKSLYLTDMFGLCVIFMFIHKSDVATWRTASVWCRKTPRDSNLPRNRFKCKGNDFFVKAIKTLKGYKIKCLINSHFLKVIWDWNNTKLMSIPFPHIYNNTNCRLGYNDACII